MLTFCIGVLFAFLILFLLSIMSVLRALFRIDQITFMPIRYLWLLLTLVMTIILIVIGMWLVLDILKIHFNVNTDEMNFFYILLGFLVGYMPSALLLNKVVSSIKQRIE